MEKVATPEVQVDQIWKDNDKRNRERYLLVKRIVERVGNPLAECVVGFPDAHGVNAIAWTKQTTLGLLAALPSKRNRVRVGRLAPIR